MCLANQWYMICSVWSNLTIRVRGMNLDPTVYVGVSYLLAGGSPDSHYLLGGRRRRFQSGPLHRRRWKRDSCPARHKGWCVRYLK